MPADPENVGLWAQIAAFFGVGGGGAAIIKQIHAQGKTDQRITALEATAAEHAVKIDTVETTLSALNERSLEAKDRGNRIEAKLDRLLER